MSDKLTHFDADGKAVMVDVSGKEVTTRVAEAKGRIMVGADVFRAIESGSAGKGDVLGVARVAGIMAVKRTAELIPMCHPLAIETCSVHFSLNAEDFSVEAACVVKISGRTGVEMEALTGVSVALLTIYDMCKAMNKGMLISDIRLQEKSGGKSGLYRREG